MTQGPLERFGNLQPQEVILGLFGEYVGLKERAWSGGLVHLLGDLGFMAPASRVALNRVIARGLLAPEKEGRLVFYSITPRLELIHEEGRRRTFSPVVDLDWTGQWTLVWYTIPEEQRLQRGRFGRWLSLRAYGSLQDGTWICPGNTRKDVAALAARLGLDKYVLIFVGDLGENADLDPLIRQAWKIDDLKQMYDVFVEEFGPYMSPGAHEALQDSEVFVLRTRMIEMFRLLTTLDPQIPDEVLGVEWQRREAIEIFLELQKILYHRAAQYFRGHAVTMAL
ncbi:PaaX family transcriptional regulator [Actibacterium sp. D379-3]